MELHRGRHSGGTGSPAAAEVGGGVARDGWNAIPYRHVDHQRLAFVAFVVAIPLFLIITNLRVVVNAPVLYSYGFEQYEIERVTGIERGELLSAGKQIRDYFNNEERWLDVRVRMRGEVVPLYNTTEILHMWDVKVLIRTLYNVQLIVGLYILLFIPAGLAIAPRVFPRMPLEAHGMGGRRSRLG